MFRYGSIWLIFSLVTGLAWIAPPASAQSVKEIDQNKICTPLNDGRAYVDGNKIALAIFFSGRYPVQKIMANNNNRLDMHVVRNNIYMDDDLADFLESMDPSLFRAAYKRRPSPSEIAREPSLGYEAVAGSIQPGYIIFPTRDYAAIECLNYERPPAGGPGGQTGDDDDGEPVLLTAEARLRGDIDNLAVKLIRETRGSKSTIPATFTWSHDFEDAQDTYIVNAAGGIVVCCYARGGDVPLQLIPFAAIHRQFSSGSARAEIDKLTTGLIAEVTFAQPDMVNTFALRTEFVTDSNADTEILTGKFVWTPIIGLPKGLPNPFKSYAYIPWLGLQAFAEINGVLRFGDVQDDGGLISVRDTSEFFYGGGKFGLSLRGYPGMKLERFTAYVNYSYLEVFEGQFDSLELLRAGIDYSFTDLNNVSVGVEFVDGRLEVTNQDVEYIMTGLNVKF